MIKRFVVFAAVLLPLVAYAQGAPGTSKSTSAPSASRSTSAISTSTSTSPLSSAKTKSMVLEPKGVQLTPHMPTRPPPDIMMQKVPGTSPSGPATVSPGTIGMLPKKKAIPVGTIPVRTIPSEMQCESPDHPLQVTQADLAAVRSIALRLSSALENDEPKQCNLARWNYYVDALRGLGSK